MALFKRYQKAACTGSPRITTGYSDYHHPVCSHKNTKLSGSCSQPATRPDARKVSMISATGYQATEAITLSRFGDRGDGCGHEPDDPGCDDIVHRLLGASTALINLPPTEETVRYTRASASIHETDDRFVCRGKYPRGFRRVSVAMLRRRT